VHVITLHIIIIIISKSVLASHVVSRQPLKLNTSTLNATLCKLLFKETVYYKMPQLTKKT